MDCWSFSSLLERWNDEHCLDDKQTDKFITAAQIILAGEISVVV